MARRFPVLLLLVSLTAAPAQPKAYDHSIDIRKPSPPPLAVKGMPYSGELLGERTLVFDSARIKQTFV